MRRPQIELRKPFTAPELTCTAIRQSTMSFGHRCLIEAYSATPVCHARQTSQSLKLPAFRAGVSAYVPSLHHLDANEDVCATQTHAT